jgi:hypothetical protein
MKKSKQYEIVYNCKFNQLTSKNLKNLKYDKLTILRPLGQNIYKSWIWESVCECGNVVLVTIHFLSHAKHLCCKNCIIVEKQPYIPTGERAFNALFSMYKNDSQRRGRNFSFELSKDKFKTLTQTNCFYCGDSPSAIIKSYKDNYIYNGVDRINSLLGYTLQNVVSCCTFCNRAKMKYSYSEFIQQIQNIYDYINNK